MLSNAPGTCSTGMSTAGTKQYVGIGQTQSVSNPSTEAARSTMCGAAFSCLSVYIKITTPPGVGTVWTFTLQKNGSDTTITGTISGTDDSVTLSGGPVSFAAGDTISLAGQATTGTPSGMGAWQWSLLNSGTGVVSYFGATSTNLNASSTVYNSPLGLSGEAWSTTETDFSVIIPCDGTIDNLFAQLSGTPGVAKSYDITLMKGGVAQTVTVNLNDTALHSDTTHSFAVSAGNLLSIRSVPNGTPTARSIKFGWRFTPTTDGQFFLAFGNPATPSTTVNTVETGSGVGANLWQTTTTNHKMIFAYGFMLKKIYVSVSAAPGAGGSGKSYDFHAAKNGADSVLHKLISETATSGNAAVDLAVAKGDYLYIKAKPTATPTAGAVKTGILIQAAPASSGGMLALV